MAWWFLFAPGRMPSCLSRTLGAGTGLTGQGQHFQKQKQKQASDVGVDA